MPHPSLASPCVNVCQIDLRTGWCRGCGRTLEEIAGWPSYDATQKRAVLVRVEQRLATQDGQH